MVLKYLFGDQMSRFSRGVFIHQQIACKCPTADEVMIAFPAPTNN